MSFDYEAQERCVENLPPGSVKRIENGENIEPFGRRFVNHIRRAVTARNKIQDGLDREQKLKDKANKARK